MGFPVFVLTAQSDLLNNSSLKIYQNIFFSHTLDTLV